MKLPFFTGLGGAAGCSPPGPNRTMFFLFPAAAVLEGRRRNEAILSIETDKPSCELYGPLFQSPCLLTMVSQEQLLDECRG